jgi:hypothetical protein
MAPAKAAGLNESWLSPVCTAFPGLDKVNAGDGALTVHGPVADSNANSRSRGLERFTSGSTTLSPVHPPEPPLRKGGTIAPHRPFSPLAKGGFGGVVLG